MTKRLFALSGLLLIVLAAGYFQLRNDHEAKIQIEVALDTCNSRNGSSNGFNIGDTATVTPRIYKWVLRQMPGNNWKPGDPVNVIDKDQYTITVTGPDGRTDTADFCWFTPSLADVFLYLFD